MLTPKPILLKILPTRQRHDTAYLPVKTEETALLSKSPKEAREGCNTAASSTGEGAGVDVAGHVSVGSSRNNSMAVTVHVHEDI